MSFDDPELVAEFITESREHLADVEGQLLAIEAGGANVDVDLVNTVFRGVHSIKGAAGFLGLTTVNRLAHSLENVLGRMRTLELTPTPAIVDVMLRAADTLTKLINEVGSSNDADVSAHTRALDEIFESREGSSDAAAASPAQEQAELAPPAVVPAPAAPLAQPVAQAAPALEASAPTPPCAPAPVAAAPASAPAAAVVEGSIRVQVGVLDSLMNLAGELVLGRNQLLQSVNAEGHAGLEAVAARLDQVTTELQEAIMRTRMQPIGAVFSRFPRVVRDLSNKLGKLCEVEMEGKEVEVDKTILEAIGDPLTHLVRNSIDHGVERPDARTAAGKPACGTVRLRAYHQAGKVRIDVADDGGGINPARLKQKAMEKGILSPDQCARMGDREAIRLIFHPGFSTAEQITDVSGRGVGMDVVRTNIEKLGGAVDIDSTPGRGTTIQITLPLTLAIIPSLIIRCREECFAVPQVNVLELVRIRANESQQHISRVKDAEVLRLRGELLPLVRLDRLFSLAAERPTDGNEPVSVIVIESGLRRYGLVVDEIVDSEEIVVKPLGRHVKSCNCLAGATILGDGRVALILDAAGLAARAQFADPQSRDAANELQGGASAAADDLQELIMFGVGPDRFAAPMSLITRLERVCASDVKLIGEQRLLQYRGSSLPLLRLEDFVPSHNLAEAEHYFVVVFRAARREVGLLVGELNDIRQLAPAIDPQMFHDRAIAGSFVLNGATIRLVDLVGLAELAHPDWFTEEAALPAAEGEAPLVLVAEDSAFFRKQVCDFMVSKGFRVVACEDGALAWEYLTGEPHGVALVITDIEMPNVNGFELCRRIKQHAQLRSLPVIALTSLASEADVERGREAGIDDYQVKMDRERVMDAVARLLPRMKSQRALEPAPRGRAVSSSCLYA
ncbi:MAG TPA: chemotaxis protein CheW [Lacipirellulaceae bacterium]|nr:chemotaxis protein CheW [Lacipirellulaceae bacterium]